jgi:4-hydroxybenzoate polyprenyltransferase
MKIFSLFRPRQQIKNFLIFLPGIISSEIFRWPLQRFWMSFVYLVGFAVISGNVYVINDLADFRKDKLHPVKSKRTLASGALSKMGAVTTSLVSIAALEVLIHFSPLSFRAQMILVSYFLINVVYSLKGKEIPYWEMVMVSFGFVLRVLLGALLVSRKPSFAFFEIIFFGSLMIVMAKRFAELSHDENIQRKVLKSYSSEFIKSGLIVVTAIIVFAYCTYVSSGFFLIHNVVARCFLYASAIPFLLIILELLDNSLKGKLEQPEQVITSKPLAVSALLWLTLFIGYSWFNS